MEHILLFERVFGPLPRRCCVHHRDENPWNNSVENLMCIPVALHLELHARLRGAKKDLGDLAYAVERQRITAEYEARARELIAFWEFITE